MKKHLINSLRLVYPPVSNQEADWLWEDERVKEFIRASKLYFIAQRHEIYFENFKFHGAPFKEGDSVDVVLEINENSYLCEIGFDIRGNSHQERGLKLILPINIEEFNTGSIVFEFGPKIIRVVSGDRRYIFGWWTPDKLLFDHWRQLIQITGFSDFRKFTNYHLHYVGISKDEDSFTRLFKRGHEKRAKILSNEGQFKDDARLTDELMIFFFDIEELGINFIDSGISEEGLECSTDDIFNPRPIEKSKLIADAEKAFVSLLDCKYNKIKYKNYPRSKDGLYDEDLTRYGFHINENVTFITDSTDFVGDLDPLTGFAGPKADLIIVEGDVVKFIKSVK